VFGFGKVFVVGYIPLHVNLSFQCGSSAETVKFSPPGCSDLPVVLPASSIPGAINLSTSSDGQYIMPAQSLTFRNPIMCSKACQAHIPPEIYFLSFTFVLTFFFSLSIAYDITHLGNGCKDHELSQDDTPEVVPAVIDTSSTGMLSQQLLPDEPNVPLESYGPLIADVPGPHAQQQQQDTFPGLRGRNKEIRAGRYSASLEEGIDLHMRARLLHAALSRRLVYRVLRDVSSILKFIITLVSVSLQIYGPQQSLIQCKASSASARDALDLCSPGLASDEKPYAFIMVGGFSFLVFCVASALEKYVPFPRQARTISNVLLLGLSILAVAEFAVALTISGTALAFRCTLAVKYIDIPFFVDGHCSDISPAPISSCRSSCHAVLPASAVMLVVSMLLTYFFAIGIVIEYRRLANVLVRHQLDDNDPRLAVRLRELHGDVAT